MKKLLLILTVLACGIGQVSAWDWVKLIYWKDATPIETYEFTKISDNDYRILIPSSLFNGGDFYFKFKDSNSDTWGPWNNSENNVTVPTGESASYGSAKGSNMSGSYSFMIPSSENTDSKLVVVKVEYSSDKWNVRYYTRPATTFNVKFDKPVEWNGRDKTAYIYAYDSDGVQLLGNWPGTTMTYNESSPFTFSVKAPKNEEGKFNKVVFHEWWDSRQTANLTLFSGEYNNSGITKQTVSLTSNDYGTFSSSNILTFPEGDVNIVAYKASVSEGKILMTRVTGAVPANTGLMIKRKSAGDNSMDAAVAAAASVDMTGNLMQPSTGAEVVSDGEKDRYVLAKNKSTGDIHFAKLASSREVPVGMAYLEVASGTFSASAPSLSIVFDGEDDMTTGINASLNDKAEMINDNAIYNLAGQRVSKPTKGLYIVNGRKVVVK